VSARDEESFTAVPNAVVDTNVCLAIYSWHDVLTAAQSVLDRDPNATLEHEDVQFRAQRARAAFGLTLLFNERGWATLLALNEVTRTLTARVPPDVKEGGAKSNFVKLYVYFIRDKLLPSWRAGGDLAADAAKKGDEVDLLCLDWAQQHKIPLISWEGSGPRRFNSKKLIPQEAARRGIDLVTPEALLRREAFTGAAAAKRFFAAWDRQAPSYLLERPRARETMKYARAFYMRMAENDWTP
jgi:hypothetical protein